MTGKMTLISSARKSELKAIRRYIAEHQSEPKFTEGTTTTVGTAGVVVPVFLGLVQGDTDTTRTGSRITCTKLSLRWDLTASVTDNISRVIVFVDRGSNGTAPVTADILDSASVNSCNNHRNVEVNKRFTILYDRTIATSVTGPSAACEEWTSKTNRQVGFIGNAGTAADLGTGQIYLLFINAGAAAVGARVRIRGDYTDQ